MNKSRRIMKRILFFLIAVLACSPLQRTEASPTTSEQKPNIVIFITDDESWLERSAYGWSKLPTPHFDRVAQAGVLFTHGYTSAPSCAPSRASLLTGRNFWELEQGAFIQAWLPKKFAVLPQMLAAGGYHVGSTGKGWGPGVYPSDGHGRDSAGPPVNHRQVSTLREHIRSTDYAANFAAFVESSPENKPFFFWVGVGEPHRPWAADNHERLEAEYGVTVDDVAVPGILPDTPETRLQRANMLYEVCHADDQLGGILDILKARNELKNTLLIVTSDNGTPIDRSKASLYDWGVHEPLAVMWPTRVPGGRRVDDFVTFPDLTPTMLEAAGLPVPADMTGRSILDVLLSDKSGQVDPTRDSVVTGLEWHGEFDPQDLAGRTVRDSRYAYIINYGKTPREELYDLEYDPWQTHSVVDEPKYAAIKQRLKARLEAYQRQTNDPRVTGDMKIFEATRKFVQERKRNGYRR